MKINALLKLNERTNDIKSVAKAINNAELLLTLPDAMGRNFFVGCRESVSLSERSLIIYPVEEAREKAKNAITIFKNISAFANKMPPKNGGARTNRFFTQ